MCIIFLRDTTNYGSILKSDRCSKKKVPPTTNTTVAGKNTKSMPDLI